MVKRVFGRVDGQEVELYADSGDRWSVPIPFDADGEYVVEILAEDDAGNQAYMAKMLFVVNTACSAHTLSRCHTTANSLMCCRMPMYCHKGCTPIFAGAWMRRISSRLDTMRSWSIRRARKGDSYAENQILCRRK